MQLKSTCILWEIHESEEKKHNDTPIYQQVKLQSFFPVLCKSLSINPKKKKDEREKSGSEGGGGGGRQRERKEEREREKKERN